jgi:antagonist of KipI
MALAVLMPGALTTVQDAGRHHARRFGVPQAGALDMRSFRAANALVGSGPGAAALEVTLRGPVVRFLHATTFALTGAGFVARLGAQPCALWRAHRARAGQQLDVGSCTRGVRGYLAVRGGIDVPLVLGSRSTCLRGGFGGLDGRALRADDWLAVGDQTQASTPPVGEPPELGGTVHLRLSPGPHAAVLGAEDWELLTTSPLRLRADSDRMGARLDAPALQSSRPEILTIPTLPGSVQLTPGGQLIVLLNDAQTAGGYPVIATVGRDDLDKLAQARPGATVLFSYLRDALPWPQARRIG